MNKETNTKRHNQKVDWEECKKCNEELQISNTIRLVPKRILKDVLCVNCLHLIVARNKNCIYWNTGHCDCEPPELEPHPIIEHLDEIEYHVDNGLTDTGLHLIIQLKNRIEDDYE